MNTSEEISTDTEIEKNIKVMFTIHIYIVMACGFQVIHCST